MKYNADSKHLAYFKPANSNRSHNRLIIMSDFYRTLMNILLFFDKGRMIEYLRQDIPAETLTITKKGMQKNCTPTIN